MKSRHVRTWITMLGIAGLWSVSGTGLAAAEFRSGDKVIIKADEVIDGDLYVATGELTVDGIVKGDLVAFGRVIHINGTVEGDVMAAGQAIVLNGKIDDGARLGGQVLRMTSKATLGNDLFAAGFSLETERGCTIDGDVVYGGYQAKLAGNIQGDVKAGLANCEINSTIGGDVELDVGVDDGGGQQFVMGNPPPIAIPSVPGGLTIGENTSVSGKLAYQSPREAKMAEGAKIAGGIEYSAPKAGDPAAAPAKKTVAEIMVGKLRHFACLAIVGGILVLLFPRSTQRLADTIRARPAATFGGGVLGLVLFWIGLIVLIVAIIVLAILLGLATLGELVPWLVIFGVLAWLGLLGGFFFFVAYLAEVVAGYTIGRALLFAKNPGRHFVALLLGLAIFVALTSIPYVGWIFGLVALFVAMGAVLIATWSARNEPAPVYVEPKPVA